MYRTPDGIRVLQGAERQLFVESLAMIVDMLTEGEGATDIQVLDDLTPNQLIAAYHAVARALLIEDEKPPALTAVIEATVASVYRHARDMISMELDDAQLEAEGVEFAFGELPEATGWREAAIAAGRAVGLEELPDLDDQDSDAWDLLIECLEDHLLWDNDWEMVEQLDAAPDVARRLKKTLGISDDYFVAVPHDPSDAQTERLLAELRTLTRDVRWENPDPSR